MTKNRARISILSELLSFPTINSKDWTSCYFETPPEVGDLVAMNCAPSTKYYLSWLREINEDEYGIVRYLLESIEDGELCWWTNIGLSYYDRVRVSERPSWKWDDDQFGFNDRWLKVCQKNDTYIVLPCQSKFDDNGGVVLDVRIRFGLDDYRNPVHFDNWKKITNKEMDKYYKNSLEKYEMYKKLIKEQSNLEEQSE